VNVAHQIAENVKIEVFDLNSYYVSSVGGLDIPTTIEPFTAFPHHVQTAKILINKILGTSNGDLSHEISHNLRFISRIFSWMHRKVIDAMIELERCDLEEISECVGNFGWWKVLNYDSELERLAESLKSDSDLRAQLSGVNKDRLHSINVRFLEKKIGLPLHSKDIPQWFRAEVAEGSGKQPQEARFSRTHWGTDGEHSDTLYLLNRLAHLPGGVDSISFDPFPTVQSEVRRLREIRAERARVEVEENGKSNAENSDDDPENSGQSPSQHATPNFPVNLAIRMLEQAVKCVYEWPKPILSILDLARAQLLKESKHDYQRDYIAFPFEKANSILREAGLPFQIETQSMRSTSITKVTLRDLVATMMFSCAFLATFNHGRRPNEIIGNGKPYGLYFGCVTPIQAANDLYSIELYVQKQPREYATFWCTKIVADCITLLEDIAQRYRPLFKNLTVPHDEIIQRRRQQLFRQRNFSRGSFARERPHEFEWRSDSTLFFALAGVDETFFHNAQIPCRRMFISLFVRRYEFPELVALQNHLLDLRIESLRAYYLEPAHRRSKDRHEQVLRNIEAEALDIDNMLKEERSSFLQEMIERMLRNEPFGGAFPRIINKVIKKLSRSLHFISDSCSGQAKKVTTELERRGYENSEKINGNCMAGEARHMRQASHCCENGKLHPENASPQKCHGCIHSLTSETTVLIFEQDRDDARAKAENIRLPKAIRNAAAVHAKEMDKLIEQERALAERNRAMIAEMINGWLKIHEVQR
jgi:hypothetical protein